MELIAAVRSFLESREPTCVPGTINTYRKHLAPLARFWPRDLSAITPADLDSYLAVLTGDHLSPITIRKRAIATRTFLSWCHTQGLCAPLRLAIPKTGKRIPKALSFDDERKLIALEMQPQERAIIELLLDSGLRLAEANNLRWQDLDLNRGTVRVIGKGDKERICVFSDACAESLRRWRSSRLFTPDPDEMVFRGRQGPFTVGALYRYIKRIFKRARISGSPHVLRHTFARDYLDAGGNIYDLKELMGHTDIRTTIIYLSVARESLAQKHKKFSPVNRLKG